MIYQNNRTQDKAGRYFRFSPCTGHLPATVNKSLAHLERIGIVGELTNRQRDRVFSYVRYVGELTAEVAVPG